MVTPDAVVDVLARVTEVDDLADQMDLRLYDEHVLDSFRTVELILALESEFGIEIPPSEVERETWATPRLIADYVVSRVGS